MRIADIGRRIEAPRPMRLRRIETLGAAVIEDLRIEAAIDNGAVVLSDRLLQLVRIQSDQAGELPDRIGLDRRKHRRHEQRRRLLIDDRPGDLPRLLRHQPTPDRIALRPDIFALVIEPLRITIDDDAERNAIQPGHDAAIELRRTRVDRDRMELGRITDLLHTLRQQILQHSPAGIRRAADEEVVRCLPPILAQPLDIRLKPAGRHHEGLGA